MRKINPDILEKRSRLYSFIRTFFSSHGYVEAEVPVLAGGVIPEPAIELFMTLYRNPYGLEMPMYLLPSPEYYLKQMIAAGSGSIFSISRAFRNSEQIGRQHNPEFSMLEYYAMEADYIDSIGITEELFSFIAGQFMNTPGGSEQNPAQVLLTKPFLRIPMDEAFIKYAGLDISRHCTGQLSPQEEKTELAAAAVEMGLNCSAENSWEELFNLIFVHKVEPALPQNRPIAIYDYPAGVPALARKSTVPGRLQRWELYAGGMELANCYSEETDFNEVSDFFRLESERKNEALISAGTDFSWCEMYRNDFPECSGTALGLDRLLMLLTGEPSMEGVIFFPFSDIIRGTS